MKIALGFFLAFVSAISSVNIFFSNRETPFLSALPSMVIAILLGYFSWVRLKNSWVESDMAVQKWEADKKREAARNELLAEVSHKRIDVKYLGGSGYELIESELYTFGAMRHKIRLISAENKFIDINFSDISAFEVGGLGTTTTNAGISGGGFGLEGFIKGAVTAAVINAATTKSSTNTFLKVTSKVGELFLHTSLCEPEELRMMLSPLSVNISNRTNNPNLSVADEIIKLNELVNSGVISKEDFRSAKEKLLSSS